MATKRKVANAKRMKLAVKKGDTVLILAGKDKGQQGKVMKTEPKKERVYVESLNIHKRHVKGDGANKVSGIMDKEGPIHVSNVKIVEKG